MSLYKYTNAFIGIEILKNCRIRFTQPLAFNDPFDVSPFISSIYTDEQLDKFLMIFFNTRLLIETALTNAAMTAYGQLPPFVQAMMTVNDFKEMAKKKMLEESDTYFDFFKKHTDSEKIKETIIKDVINIIGNEIGVLSLSTVNDSLLMWAHYADAHRGLILEFDENHPFFLLTDPTVYSEKIEINYSNERPIIDLNPEENRKEFLLQIAKAVFFTKSKDWSYENEFRILRYLENAIKTGSKDQNAFDIYLFDLPENCIRSVILGCRIRRDDEKTIKEILNQSRYSNIKLKRAKTNAKSFKLDIS